MRLAVSGLIPPGKVAATEYPRQLGSVANFYDERERAVNDIAVEKLAKQCPLSSAER